MTAVAVGETSENERIACTYHYLSLVNAENLLTMCEALLCRVIEKNQQVADLIITIDHSDQIIKR